MIDKKILLVDFDDVICESAFLIKVNQFLGTNYTLDNFKNYFIDEIVPIELRQNFYDWFMKEDFYKGVPMKPNTREVLEKLNKVYDIYICSACVMYYNERNSAMGFAYKYNYLLENLPFLDPKKFIFTNSKKLVMGDILIDDSFDKLTTSKVGTRVLFEAYHNKDIEEQELEKNNIKRAKNWLEVEKILLG